MVKYSAPAAIAGFLFLLFFSCTAPKNEIHLHDRHGLSYPLIREYTRGKSAPLLVLIDYHHDAGPLADGLVTSFNWAGTLLLEGSVSGILWVPGVSLPEHQKQQKAEWLASSLNRLPPGDSADILDRTGIYGWDELIRMKLKQPAAISIDLDFFTLNGIGDSSFIKQAAEWTALNNSGLVTVALSAAYQKDPGTAWKLLEEFIRVYPADRTAWFLEADGSDVYPESNEERKAWEQWTERQDVFQGLVYGFYPGETLWIKAPAAIRALLCAFNIQPGDDPAAAVLSFWKSPDLAALEKLYPPERIADLFRTAAAGIEDAWADRTAAYPDQAFASFGTAVRLTDGTGDRGCLALYSGVSDAEASVRYCAYEAALDPRYIPLLPDARETLDVELSFFGEWRDMAGPYDFRPGIDSLLVTGGGETAFLQAGAAADRMAEKEVFLRVLLRKAGISGSPEESGLAFKKAETLTFRRRLDLIE
ncbi:AMMECR1 domain-containing protein [Breznakiella homolactica]|uniref:AMMECR1 domain-containing protein n=1 Tax=Breznakiella homolactica TaxID=2798577 RepID=A0A7T7XQ75_9SPIR|nr:AMMECR1 domain-containing protein [Breznakiella homolactica]QQO10448.1 AMMECR1 domain-containing protein [Breznakiella homolactica]